MINNPFLIIMIILQIGASFWYVWKGHFYFGILMAIYALGNFVFIVMKGQ
jgi:hypothetical protein